MTWLLTCIISVTPISMKCDRVQVDKDTVFCIQMADDPAIKGHSRSKERPVAMAPREKCIAILKEEK